MPTAQGGDSLRNGGQGGIRTHDTLAGMPHFECGAIDHSTTCPPAVIREVSFQGKSFCGLDIFPVSQGQLGENTARRRGPADFLCHRIATA